MRKFVYLWCLVSVVTLGGCSSDSSSDSDGDGAVAFVKYYNSSINGSGSSFFLDDEKKGFANFADVSSTYSAAGDSYEFKTIRTDSNGDEIELVSSQIQLTNDEQTLMMLVGDFTSPELVSLNYDINFIGELNDDLADDAAGQFELYFSHLSQFQSDLDIYIGLESEEFEQADLLSNLVYKQNSSQKLLEEESYIFYLVANGESVPFFESAAVTLFSRVTYVAVIRDNAGISDIAVDIISGSTTVSSFVDVNAATKVRVYQSIDTLSEPNIYLDEIDEDAEFPSVQVDTLTDFLSLESGDYALSIVDVNDSDNVVLRNMLLTLTHGETKTLLFFKDETSEVRGLSLNTDQRPLAFENHFTFVNLISQHPELDLFFVDTDETIESTNVFLKRIDFTDSRSITLTSGLYKLYLTSTDSVSGAVTILFQSESIDFDSSVDFMLIAEPDETTFSGFTLNMLPI